MAELLLHDIMGIPNRRAIELQEITGKITKDSLTLADALIAIADCKEYRNKSEIVFSTHQWTNGYLEAQLKTDLDLWVR